MIALLIPAGLLLIVLDIRNTIRKELINGRENLAAFADLSKMNKNEMENAARWFGDNLGNNVILTVSILKSFVTEEGAYEGPRMFADGMVVELRDQEIIYPEEVPEGSIKITPAMIRRGLEGNVLYSNVSFEVSRLCQTDDIPTENTDEAVRADKAFEVSSGEEEDWGEVPAGEEEDEEDDTEVLLTFEEITENIYYVDLTASDEYNEYMYTHVNNQNVIMAAEQSYNGAILSIIPEEETLYIGTPSMYFPECYDARELGFTKEILKKQPSLFLINDVWFICSYRKSGIESMVFLTPATEKLTRCVQRGGFFVILILMLCVVLIVYLSEILRYNENPGHSEAEMEQYSLKKARTIVMAGGIFGMVIVLGLVSFVQAVSAVHAEGMSANEDIGILFHRLEGSEQKKKNAILEEETDWYLYYGKKMASLFSQYPELASRDKLQECCDILSVDYIMLFDSQGRQTACSRDYSGFTLGFGQGENGEDFRRLLMGIPSIVHEASFDQTTGLTRQILGVTLPTMSETEKHGALIMALMPDRLSHTMNVYDVEAQIRAITPEGKMFLLADGETGEVKYATYESFIGEDITSFGLSENSLKDGYMDYATINGTRCYVIAEENNNSDIVYCITKTSSMFRNVLPYGLLAMICFAMIFLILRRYLLRTSLRGEGLTMKEQTEAVPENLYDESRWKKLRCFFNSSRWSEWLPDEKAKAIFKAEICFGIMAAFLMELNLNRNISGYDSGKSLLNYILTGNWMRGFNLFSISSILIIIAYAFIILQITKPFLKLASHFLGNKGDTVCRMIYNFLEYITVFVVLYYAFDYLGFPTSTVLASLSLVSLALTLGAQNLVADILAGVFIVIEGEFRVGDIVEIGGFRGTVKEIGIKSTKIVGPGNDLKIIDNRDIKNVINKVSFNSVYALELKIPMSESLVWIEVILSRDLPKIKENYSQIVNGPNYLGVNSLANGTMTLLILAECMEKDIYDVQRIVNREVRLILEREKIKMV